jgi:SP family facilitated glucose transporter-like MFS transporter 8
MKFRVTGNLAYTAHFDAEMNPLADAETAPTPTVNASAFCNWRLLALVNVVPSIVLGLLAGFIPESPTWVATKLNKQRVKVSDPVGSDVSRTEQSSDTLKPTMWRLLMKSRKQLIVGVVLQFFQQFSGINAVMFFCTSIMREARVSHAETYSATVMLEQVVVTGVAVMLMDIAGRKVLLLIGASVMAAACGIIGIYFLLVNLNVTGIFIIVLIGMYSYIAAFSIGVGAIPWLILGEIFPAETRAAGASIATCANWIFAFVVTLAYQPAAAVLTTQGVMWFFGICCIGLVIFTALCVPETKGKTFAEIQLYFADDGPTQLESKDVAQNGSKTSASSENDPLIGEKRSSSREHHV